MKTTIALTAIVTIASITTPALADLLDFELGLKAAANIFKTPKCAKRCIFDPHYQETYAPDCSNLSAGVEMARRLCENQIYQQMMDNCIKEKCGDDDRQKVHPENGG